MNNKNLILVRGLPGSGKTTMANIFANDDTAVLAADDYFTNEHTGEYNFIPEEIGQAHTECQKRCLTCMKNEVSTIVVHNTFTRESEMDAYFKMAKENDYIVHTVIVENRHGNSSVHGVPQKTMKKMAQRFDIKL